MADVIMMEEVQQRQNGNKVSVEVAVVGSETTTEISNNDAKSKIKKYIKLRNEDTISQRVKCCAAEFLGTFVLVFVGCMSCVFSVVPPPIDILMISFAFGIAVIMAIQSFGHISGAHINPAVTLAAILLGYMPLSNLPFYWISQILGAFAGYGILYGLANEMKPATGAPYCVSQINPNLSELQGFGVEFIITTILIWTCCGVWDARNSDKHDSVSIRLGLAITGLAAIAIPFSSASMNPARSLAPAIIGVEFKNLWVFCVAPLLGAAFAALSYRLLFEYKKRDDE